MEDLQTSMSATQDTFTQASSMFGGDEQSRIVMGSNIDSIGAVLENSNLDVDNQKLAVKLCQVKFEFNIAPI